MLDCMAYVVKKKDILDIFFVYSFQIFSRYKYGACSMSGEEECYAGVKWYPIAAIMYA